MCNSLLEAPRSLYSSPGYNNNISQYEGETTRYHMKKDLVCQTIDYMQMSYDYEYKELSIPFWSTCLSSPLKYFMGVWSFVIVYFQQNKSLLKCTSLGQLVIKQLQQMTAYRKFVEAVLWRVYKIRPCLL
jgi:hypothetical protein